MLFFLPESDLKKNEGAKRMHSAQRMNWSIAQSKLELIGNFFWAASKLVTFIMGEPFLESPTSKCLQGINRS
jgi:hypothetical protein